MAKKSISRHIYRVQRNRPDPLRLGGLESVDRVENFLAVQTVLHSQAALEIVVVEVVQEGSVHSGRDERLLVLSQGQRLQGRGKSRPGQETFWFVLLLFFFRVSLVDQHFATEVVPD